MAGDYEPQNSSMKFNITRIVQITVVAAAGALVLPARADTLSVPSAENSAFTLEVPSGWQPKTDKADQSVDALSPDGHAYVSSWLVVTADPKAEEKLTQDLAATLKDSLKSVDETSRPEPFEVNGATGVVVNGSGIEKRAGTKMKFRVVLVPAGKNQIAIVYTDFDYDAPKETIDAMEGILKSIKVAPKK
jgi:hypothetical protein